jgi:hypothetical protein
MRARKNIPLTLCLPLVGLAAGACIPPSAPLPQTGGGADNIQPGVTPQSAGGGSLVGDLLLGLYVAELSDSVTGHAYMEVRQASTAGQFLMTTIEGTGFVVTINEDASITIVGMLNEPATASGTGSVLGQDSFMLRAAVSGSPVFPDGDVTIEASRLSGTDASFPLDVSPISTSVLVSQGYVATITTRDPVSGTQDTLTGQQVFINPNGTSATLILVSGDENRDYTIVFYAPLRAAVRVVAGGTSEFETFSGSTTNTGNDVVGRLDFAETGSSTDSFTATLATQTPGALGTQTQQVISINAEASESVTARADWRAQKRCSGFRVCAWSRCGSDQCPAAASLALLAASMICCWMLPGTTS